jgi:hypothetical protein
MSATSVTGSSAEGAVPATRVPALPFTFGTSLACVVSSLALTVLAAGVIGHYRGYVVTYGIVIVVSVLTVGLSVAVA